MKDKEYYLKRELFELAKEDHSLFEFITNFSLNGLWFWDLENPEHEYFNDQFWLTLGYDPNEMPHRSSAWQDMIDPKDAKLAERLVQEHIQDPTRPYRQMIRYTHRSGRDVWIRCIGKVIFKEGKPVRMLGVHIDVSDEIRAVADLKNYFEEIKDLILIADNEARISSFNSLWRDYLVENTELEGANIFEVIREIGLQTDENIEASIRKENRLNWQSAAVLDNLGQEHFFDVSLILSEKRYFLIAHEVSEQRNMLKVVQRKQALLDLLLKFSSKFIDVSADTVEDLINESLERVGTFVRADRAYIFDYDFVASTTSNTHEWCAEGIEPQINNLQDVPMEAFPDWLEHHLRAEPMIIPSVKEYPESSLKEILASQAIKSLVAVPIMVNSDCLGFVGFDWVESEVEASYEELQVLEVLANMISHVSLRKEQDTRLFREHAINKNIIERISYPLLVVDTYTRKHVLVNESFEKLIGYNHDELKLFEEPFPYWSLEENEIDNFHDLYQGVVDQLDLEIISKAGEKIPVRVSNHPVFADEHQTSLVILGLENLTGEKAFIEQIEKERSFNQEVLEKSPLYFISINRNFDILKLNPSAEAVFKELGISLGNGKAFLAFLSERSKDPISQQEILEHLSLQKEGLFKIISEIPEDTKRFVEWSLSLSPQEKGLDEILIFGQDVSVRENFITEIERSRQQLKDAQELALVGNFNLDLRKGSIELSDNMETIVPIDLKPELGLGLDSLVRNRFQANWSKVWTHQLKKEGALKYGDWFNLGGIEKYLEFRLHTLDTQNDDRIFGTIQDLSEIKRQEKELKVTRDRLFYKSNLLANILQISRYIADENLEWYEILRKSFDLLIKNLDAEFLFYLKRKNSDEDNSFQWKMLYHKGEEINDEKDLASLGDFKLGTAKSHKNWLKQIKAEGYFVANFDELAVPFTRLRLKYEHQFKKITLFPIYNNDEIQFLWGFIESEEEPWDEELFDTFLRLANDFSRTYGLRQAYLKNQEMVKSYELISNATGAAIWQLDLEKKQFTRGPGYKELLGYNQETIPFDGETLIRRIAQIDRSDFEKVMDQMIAGKIENWQGALRICHAEGHLVNIIGSIAAVKDYKGRVKSLVGSFSESPDFLKDSFLLEKAASVTRLAAWELDMNGPSIRYTDYLNQLLNLPADYKIHFDHLDELNKIQVLLENEWTPSPKAIFKELNANPDGLLRDYRLRFEGPQPDKWLRVKSFPVSEDRSSRGQYMGVIQDITESVLDKQQITQAFRWLEKAQRVGQLGYFLLSEENDSLSWKVSEVLGGLLEVEPDQENLFEKWLKQVVEKYRSALKESILKSFETGNALLKRCEVYTLKTRQRLWIEISGEIQFDEEQNERVMLGTVRNITDAMENLRSMDDQNKRLREIAWAQSHLVRAPLTRMHGLLDEINTGQLSDKERNLFFDHFKESIGELDGIVKDVIKKAQILEEDGVLSGGFAGSYANFKGIEVHVVDDDPIIRTLHERVVLKSGLVSELNAYQSGKEFLEFIESGFNREQLQVVLLDLNMPDLNGWDVLDRIKALDLEEQIIVVVTTSSTDNADLRASYKYSSVIDYVEKPLNYSKMTRIINLAPIKAILKNNKQQIKST